MAPSDKKHQELLGEHAKLTSADLHNILEVNKKTIELHMATSHQFDDIIELLKYNKEKIDEVDKALFKLILILSSIGGSIGIGTIIALIQFFIHR